MSGKQKCRILKEIRQRIADENDIPYVTRECTYQGECLGTCPRCESELRYLERELVLRTSLKKGVTVAALCAGMAGMAFTATGCSANTKPETEVEELSGEVDEFYGTTDDSSGYSSGSQTETSSGDTGAAAATAATAATAAAAEPEMIELTGEVDEGSYYDQNQDGQACTAETAKPAESVEVMEIEDDLMGLVPNMP